MRYSGVAGGAYTDLLTCLVMELNVGNLRASSGFVANHNVPIDNLTQSRPLRWRSLKSKSLLALWQTHVIANAA
jgi:hypothetical protein